MRLAFHGSHWTPSMNYPSSQLHKCIDHLNSPQTFVSGGWSMDGMVRWCVFDSWSKQKKIRNSDLKWKLVISTYFRLVVVASISRRNPLSFSCDIHELQPKIALFEIDIKKSGLACRNDLGGLRGVLKKTIGSFSFEKSQFTWAMRSRNAVTSGFFSSNRSNLDRTSSWVRRFGCGSRNSCDGVWPKLFIIPSTASRSIWLLSLSKSTAPSYEQ